MVTYLLTGEERTTYSQPITPLRPFDPFHPFTNPGAWELVVRASHLDLGSQVFAPGPLRLADPNKYSNNASEITVGSTTSTVGLAIPCCWGRRMRFSEAPMRC
jgi:hypothetical protein